MSTEVNETLTRGEALGRYIVIERLGEGASGIVYAAYDPELDRKVAIKILRRKDGDATELRRQARFVREAKAIARLTHQNVVGIHDVGVHDGRVFLAMEYLAGGTLREWMAAKKRPWREVVKMFIEVGRGLAAAHAEGLVHRDFKPDNVLLDRTGTPKVADFGLARLSGPASADSGEDVTAEIRGSSDSSSSDDVPLTRTGSLAGTPAYMAPEQFRGKATDGRTDQFAFCVALHEALYGVRPFDEETVFELADSVIRERIKVPPRNANVPSWVRRSLLRGLRANPEQRYEKVEDLLAALAADPVARVRRIALATVAVVVLAGSIGGLYRRSERRRVEFESRVTRKVDEGRAALAEAEVIRGWLMEARARAFAAFDGGKREEGESGWAEARADAAKLESTLKRAQAVLEAAEELDHGNEQAREALGETVLQRALLAELEVRKGDLGHLVEQLKRLDPAGRLTARWADGGMVDVRTSPVGARLAIERFDPSTDESGERLVAVSAGEPFVSPSGQRSLPPGSYRVTATKEGFAPTRHPFVLGRGEQLRLDLRLPPAKDVPADFVYVPEGRFLYGDADEDWRTAFLNAVPIHERSTDAFLIKAHETTFGEWLEFIRDLPPAERRLRTPSSAMVQGGMSVKGTSEADWSVELKISGDKALVARYKEPLIFPGRQVRASQDWLRMPVVGITQPDMQAYLDWLARTGRVPGARFCTDVEWERAARGADGRPYPASLGRLQRDDANFDETYGRVRGSFGPDEVGAHPRSESPFGVADLAGNVWEMVKVADAPGFQLRGGSYYQAFIVARTTNSEPVDLETRTFIVGLRVCAAGK
jgi:formylglycine-generating enzyme required for sulfatase activity/tRNA A-37 threonylcarbamoyl transferase component Bud32